MHVGFQSVLEQRKAVPLDRLSEREVLRDADDRVEVADHPVHPRTGDPHGRVDKDTLLAGSTVKLASLVPPGEREVDEIIVLVRVHTELFGSKHEVLE